MPAKWRGEAVYQRGPYPVPPNVVSVSGRVATSQRIQLACPSGRPGGHRPVTVSPPSVLIGEICWQAAYDLASEATQACKALQLGFVDHSYPPVARFGRVDLPGFPFSMGRQKISSTVAMR